MVWFQCEDCGDQLKKPKLPNHFRVCSAYKFSCIDCGEVFDQTSVQGHTQCITEAEKYGPKGQAKATNGPAPKQKNNQKQQPDFDINVGLSDRPPWFCSLCNTKATSKQTLLLHADGKKHRAKAKAFHASQQPKPAEESIPDSKTHTDDDQKNELHDNKGTEEEKKQDPLQADANGDALSKKKRKLDASENGQASGEVGNGEVIQSEGVEGGEKGKKVKKAKNQEHKNDTKSTKEDPEKEIKWKKLITSALKSSSDGALKMKKLRKLVMKGLQDSGITKDENEVKDILEHKISSSSKFAVDKKYVRLISKAE